ncbi:hypothetical protein DPX16_5366 [Anabarilius grahami]|uniref:Uncharacterized protein n=1 Tax=Anabarilius grahami TaxID=495550 RepID=A0A3N0XS08_ANAGA|nr:hypothetical protein DPX16_5366 [Anabarilius grahami]
MSAFRLQLDQNPHVHRQRILSWQSEVSFNGGASRSDWGTITALYTEKLNLWERRYQKPIKALTKPLMNLCGKNLGCNLSDAEQLQPENDDGEGRRERDGDSRHPSVSLADIPCREEERRLSFLNQLTSEAGADKGVKVLGYDCWLTWKE